MAKVFSAEEVAEHKSAKSCWVVLYGNVYDVTDFLPLHPGGSAAIVALAGQDATEDYDPIHPPGMLEEHLPPEKKLGTVDPASLKRANEKIKYEKGEGKEKKGDKDEQQQGDPPLHTLLNLYEIEALAKKKVSPKCWAYYFSAADDLFSKEYNHNVYAKMLLRPRVFRDCTVASTATTLLGGRHGVGTPLFVSPAAMARLAHPDGERGIARGIAAFGAMQIVSNNASITPEQVVEGAGQGQIFGWQLYVQNDRRKSEKMLARVRRLGQWYKFVVLTLDAPVPGKREHDERIALLKDKGAAAVQSASNAKGEDETRPGGGGVGQQLFFGTAADLTWTNGTLDWLARHAGEMPIVLKGVQTHEDAYLAAVYAKEHPGTIQAILLSNHGGRALDTAPPAVHTLLEMRKYCPEVFETVEVWVDGGIRRGTDVVKALCLGAKAVGLGRAALWGLGAGGWEGVRRTFEILQGEMDTCMKLLGAKTVADLGPHFINSRMVERDIYNGDAGLARSGLWEAQTKARL